MDRRQFAHEMVDRYRDEIVRVMQDLVRIPSQNTPPVGEERAVQEFVAGYIQGLGLAADVYEPDMVPGLVQHDAYWPGREYRGRPNVSTLMKGRGGGRSLLLTGHADTVVLGEGDWQHPPFGAEIHDGKLYGLGSIDMKGQMGAMLVLLKALVENEVPLRGDLSYECVVDEEEGGVNATIAGRLRHGPMDGGIIPEGTDLKIYPAARGVLATSFFFKSEGTWLDVGKAAQKLPDAVEQMGYFLTHLDELRAMRRQHPVPPLYQVYPDPVPAQVTKVFAGGWGSHVPIVVPPEGRIELIVQTVPGETRPQVEGEQDAWLRSLVERYPEVFPGMPETHHRIRWLPPTQIDPAHALVQITAGAIRACMQTSPEICGAPYACDMFALHQIFKMPALLFGPAGANAHAPDEYVDLDSVFNWWECLLLTVLDWCGVEE